MNINKSEKFGKVQIGDTLEIKSIKDVDMICDADRTKTEVIEIFKSEESYVIEVNNDYCVLFCYNSSGYPNDNIYIIKLYDGDFSIIESCEQTEQNKRETSIYEHTHCSYIGENDDTIYLVDNFIYESSIDDSLIIVDKKEYFKNSVSIKGFNYAENFYKTKYGSKEWGITRWGNEEWKI